MAAPVELKPGVFGAVFTRIANEGNNRSRLALRPLALALEKQIKKNASMGSHKYGTPTPARPGSGPAVISGNLRRSITHTPIIQGDMGWETKVGTATGFNPPYPNGKKVPANQYALILEKTGLQNGATYPFLIPAFVTTMRDTAPLIYEKIYGSTWARVI